MKREQVILLVEDNQQDEILTIRSLRNNNIQNEIVVARDGAEALDRLFGANSDLKTGARQLPRVVLLDLKLPKVDGFEVLRRIRSNAVTRHLPVVILTTSREDRDIVAGYDCGANSYVCKPVDFNQFNEAIRSLGQFWLIVNETVPVER